MIAEACAAKTAAVATQQIRRHAAFIQEDVLADIAERQPVAPPTALSDDVRTALLVGVDRFF
jgi:hypothetical protein